MCEVDCLVGLVYFCYILLNSWWLIACPDDEYIVHISIMFVLWFGFEEGTILVPIAIPCACLCVGAMDMIYPPAEKN